MFYLSRDLFGLSYNSFTGDSKMIKQESSTNSEQLNSKKPTTTGGQIEAGVIKPTQFVWMPYKCDNCEKAIRIKLKVISEYGNLEDIDPPYFCKNCEDAIEAL